MTQSNTLELAKQGDVKAIAFLLNRQLQPKGITATVSRQDSCLYVMLEAAQVPNQKVLAEWIHKSIIRLGVASLEQINIYGRQTGVKIPAWNQEFELVKKSPPVTVPTEVKSAKTANATQLSIKECVEKKIKCEEDLNNLLYKLSYFPQIGKPVYLAGLSQLAAYIYDENNDSDIEIIIGGRYKTKIAFLLIRDEKILIYTFAHSLAQTKENYQRIEIDNNFDCVLGKVEKIMIAKNGIKIILKSKKEHSFYLFYNAKEKEIDHEIKNKLKTILKKRIFISEVSIIPDDEYEARKKSIMVFSIFIFLLFMLSFCSNMASDSSNYQYTSKDRDTEADVYECADEVGVGDTVQLEDIERMDSCLKRKGYSY